MQTLDHQESERAVAAVWEAVLDVDGVSSDDDFFALGGHSLHAARVIARLGVELPVRTMFEKPTLRAFAAAVATAPASSKASITRVDRDAPAKVSFVQRQMWLHQALEPTGAAYNIAVAVELRGVLDRDLLGRALAIVFGRHEAFRTSFRTSGGEPVAFYGSGEVRVDVIDAGPDLQATLDALARKPFDLELGPLGRATLVRGSADRHVLVLAMHHLIGDDWSFGIVQREIEIAYRALRAGQEPSFDTKTIDYVDYAASQRKGEPSFDYWLERLAGLEPTNLPSDFPSARRVESTGAVTRFVLGQSRVDKVVAFAKQRSLSPFMVTLAVFQWLLARFTSQTDIAVATPVSTRDASTEYVVGPFLNTLVFRTDVERITTFDALLDRVRETTLGALAHRDAPYDELVAKLRERRVSPPRVMFNVLNAPNAPLALDGIESRYLDVDIGAVQLDLELSLDLSATQTASIAYATELFEASTARRMLEAFVALLDRVLDGVPLSAIGLATPTDLATLETWQGAAADIDRRSIPVILEERARQSPDAVALFQRGEGSLAYGELFTRVNQWARVLAKHGIKRGDRVGIHLDRGFPMIVAQLSILAAGAAYVPLDPTYPDERLQHMIDDAKLALIVSQSSISDSIAWTREKTILVDIDQLVADQESGEPFVLEGFAPTDAAYVIYTSGSTGKPKGVVVQHEAVSNFLASMAKEPGMTSRDRILAVTTLGFDIHVLETLLPLYTGAAIAIATRDQASDGNTLARMLDEDRITIFQATPATWRMLVEADFRGPPGFRGLIGGEALPPDLARELLVRTSELWNMYGPTETTVWSTIGKVTSLEKGITIGRPIANTQIRILDAGGHICPIGVAGEIAIGGAGVTLGYLDRPELTSARFQDGFYRTGDRGRFRDDGLLEHFGRLDHQVKVRGHRIELGEIEGAVASHPLVSDAAVIVREDRPGDPRIVAYVTRKGREEDLARSLRDHVRKTLPAYMIPQHFVVLEALPRLPNSKLDRGSLPSPNEGAHAAPANGVEPRSGAERTIASVWEELLGISSIATTDNFFDLGGHSLLAMQAIAEIERRLGVRLEPRSFIYESLGQMAASVGAPSSPDLSSPLSGRRSWAPAARRTQPPPAPKGLLARLTDKWRGR